jgi:DnaJ-class molecular chaperone
MTKYEQQESYELAGVPYADQCRVCDGRGKVDTIAHDSTKHEWLPAMRECTACGGTGQVNIGKSSGLTNDK